MGELRDQFEQEDLEELLQEDFDPDLFYKALSNALEQLENFDDEAA